MAWHAPPFFTKNKLKPRQTYPGQLPGGWTHIQRPGRTSELNLYRPPFFVCLIRNLGGISLIIPYGNLREIGFTKGYNSYKLFQ